MGCVLAVEELGTCDMVLEENGEAILYVGAWLCVVGN